MPWGVSGKDERPTSNAQRRMKKQALNSNIQQLLLFLFSRFDTRNDNFNQFFWFFILSHSTFDVGRSMFIFF
jgi:hypothetical protein